MSIQEEQIAAATHSIQSRAADLYLSARGKGLDTVTSDFYIDLKCKENICILIALDGGKLHFGTHLADFYVNREPHGDKWILCIMVTRNDTDEPELPTAHAEAKEALGTWLSCHQSQMDYSDDKTLSVCERVGRMKQLHDRKKVIIRAMSADAYELLANADTITFDDMVFRFRPMDGDRETELITVRPCLTL